LSGDDKDEVASAGGDDSADAAAVGGDSDDSKPSDGKEPGESGAGGTDTNPEGGEDGNKPAETNGNKPADTTSAAKPKETTRKPKETTRKPKETTRKPKETSKPKETKPDPKPTSGCDEVTCLVEPNKACCRKYRSSKGSSKSNSNLKERPSKSDVKSGIARVMGRVRACGSKHGGSGLVKVRVKVSGSGRVSSASPSPGGALGRCVASAVKRARFPKTQRGVTFTYPFRF
ncbi:MAG: hypothetical protein KJO07_08995, partial [Deltaproteobacteria bacterium]|nr:hypothetical protein [Deltaproteobacteria bacterium]